MQDRRDPRAGYRSTTAAATADSDERARVEEVDKRFASLAARLALAGYTLSVVDGAAPFVASRWGLTREFATIEGAEQFLADVTGGAR